MQEELYKNIGKLFYAVAKVDGNLTFEEYKKINDIIERECKWIKETKLIGSTINEMQSSNTDPKKCFNEFIHFLKANPDIFSIKLKKLILKTANDIAYAYAGINKSELNLVAKLSIEFKKSEIN